MVVISLVIAELFWLKISFKIFTVKLAIVLYFSQKQKEDALSYHRVRGQHFVAVVFVRSIAIIIKTQNSDRNLIGNHRFISILFNPQTLVLNLVQNLASSLSSNVGLVFLTIPNLKQSKLKLSLCSV